VQVIAPEGLVEVGVERMGSVKRGVRVVILMGGWSESIDVGFLV